MAVNRRNYGRALEKESKEKQSLSDMHKKTVAKAYSNAKKNLKKLKAGKLGRIARIKRTAKELIGGKNTYLPKKKKKVTTTRTKDVTKSLSRGGLTTKEIARLRGK
jgi:Mor family transcriptional regulator